MHKKSLLFVYHSMIIGGSTTSLLSLMNSLDPSAYQIDLQLYRNEGDLLSEIPAHVNVLPPAELYKGVKGKIIKFIKSFIHGYFFKAILYAHKAQRRFSANLPLFKDCQAELFSRRNRHHYDYAIGFMEGWSNRYLAYKISATKKYAWLHSTFKNIAPDPQTEIRWMKKVDNIVFVTDACRQAFCPVLPEFASKAITIENIVDKSIILQRSRAVDFNDKAYQNYIHSSAFKIITVCRITISTKGLDRVVACAKELKRAGNNFLWYIVGGGDDEGKLAELIATADVADVLIPIGSRLNPYPFMAASDVMCMPSRYEGKPIVITESMILGVPAIVTEYLSAHDQIRHQENGIVVSNDDFSLYPALQKCLRSHSLLSGMKESLIDYTPGNEVYIEYIEKTLFR